MVIMLLLFFFAVVVVLFVVKCPYTVKFQWLEHLRNHGGNLFQIWVVRATKG